MSYRFLSSALALAAAALCCGCTVYQDMGTSDTVDYRSATTRPAVLDVPPDLSQLARDTRYQPQGGVVSASTFLKAPAGSDTTTVALNAPAAGTGTPAATIGTQSVAVQAVNDAKIERLGNERWISTTLTPEQLWPRLKKFWDEQGFTLVVDEPATGLMETDWAEDRSKVPDDVLHNLLGKIMDSASTTGLRDKFRTRVERAPGGGSEIYIAHRGLAEVYSGDAQSTTIEWKSRPPDPQLESTFLSRFLITLGVPETKAKTEVATSAPAAASAPASVPARARLLEDQPSAALQVDDNFDRAWRRVGLALDRSGFTVEDRDRTQGQYFVRYVDPATAGQDEPGFFARLFSFGKKKNTSGLARYRINVKGEGLTSTVAVYNNDGTPQKGEAGQRIVKLLLDDLK